jgi:hypothetical protein
MRKPIRQKPIEAQLHIALWRRVAAAVCLTRKDVATFHAENEIPFSGTRENDEQASPIPAGRVE